MPIYYEGICQRRIPDTIIKEAPTANDYGGFVTVSSVSTESHSVARVKAARAAAFGGITHEENKSIQILRSADSAERSYMENSGIPAFTLSRRIGSTNYRVNAHFSENEAETLEDKIFRMIQNEVLENGPDCGIIKAPQMSRPA